jgi:zinc protease
MSLLKRLIFFVFAALTVSATTPFPHETSDLKPDPAARFGALPNGLRYVIYPNQEPKGRVSLRLLIEAGSLHETDDQRGLAHFLEHMAFNGSTHYAPGTLVEFFQRMGMSFGGDTNASTSFDRTVYMLELPDTKEATLAEGLRVFGDYAGGLLLNAAEIDRERGIILSERRARDSVGFRTFVASFQFLFDGTLLPHRIPMGDVTVIEQADRARFLNFYNTWYRPELMSVVVVGDIDPAAVEKQITAALSPLAPRAPAQPAPPRGRISASSPLRVLYHFEPEAPGTTVSISTVMPAGPEPDNAANRLKYLPCDLATAMINRRLSILAKQENAPFIGGRTGVQEGFDLFRQASIDLSCKADQWSAALSVADRELRRALEHGFQPAELREATANLLNDLEQAVKTAPTRRSPNLAHEIAEGLNQREVLTSPADDLALFKPVLEKITVADCLNGLREAWATGQCNLLVAGNAVIGAERPAAPSLATVASGAQREYTVPPFAPDSPEALIAAAFEKSRATAVTAPAAETDLAWAYTHFGEPGQVTRREHLADLDLELITFANGIRLNLKKTPFQAGVVRLMARVGTGLLTEPPTQRGLSAFAAATFDAGGLGRHSVDDLRRIFAGKNVSAQFGTASDALVFNSATTPGDLLLNLQFLAAKITDPGYRPEALRQVRKGIDQLYLSFAHTANGPMATEVANLIAGGDPRFGLPAKEVLLSRSLEEVRAWLTPQLTTGAIELSIVGDFDIDTTLTAVAQTFGALAPRQPKPELTELRRVAFPSDRFAKHYPIASEIQKGLVVVYWPTTDEADVHRTRRLSVLASILGDRLRVKLREELGGTYSPNAGSFTSDTFPGYGYLSAAVDVDPGMAAKIAETVIELADDLAQQGPSDDELARAKQPLLTAIRESVRNNGYWLGSVLSRAQEKPEVLDWSRSRLSDVEAISTAEVGTLAKAYLSKTRASQVIIVPTPKAVPPAAPTPASAAPATPAQAPVGPEPTIPPPTTTLLGARAK